MVRKIPRYHSRLAAESARQYPCRNVWESTVAAMLGSWYGIDGSMQLAVAVTAEVYWNGSPLGYPPLALPR